MPRKSKLTDKDMEILKLVMKGFSIPEIAKTLKFSRQNAYKRISALCKYNYLKKRKVGKYVELYPTPITEKRLTMTSDGIQKVDKKEIHRLWFTIEILDWHNQDVNKCEHILKDIGIFYTKNEQLGWTDIYFSLEKDIEIRITPHKVVIQLKNIFFDDVEEAKNRAMDIVWKTIPRLENMFHITLEKPRKANISITSQHIAFIRSPIARYFLKLLGMTQYKIYDEKGRLRWVVDNSEGKMHFEAVDKALAEEDFKRVDDLILDVTTGKFDHRKLQERQIMNEMALSEIIETQKEYSKAIQEHLKLVMELQKVASVMNMSLNEIKKRQNNNVISRILKIIRNLVR